MKKRTLLLIIWLMNANFGLAQNESDSESLINMLEFKIEFFNPNSLEKINTQNLKPNDSIGIKYILVVPDGLHVKSSDIKKPSSFKNFNFYQPDHLKKYEPIKRDKEKKIMFATIMRGILIPKSNSRHDIEPKKITLNLKIPTDRRDIFGDVIYEAKTKKVKLKSEAFEFTIN